MLTAFMPSVRQKREMAEFLCDLLERGGASVSIEERKLFSGEPIVSHYLKVSDARGDGRVFCVDRAYPGDKFERVVRSLRQRYDRFAPVFYKDGSTFFRTAAPLAHGKRDGRSMKRYGSRQANATLQLRPEERLWRGSRDDRLMQYFQPDSDRLDTALVTVTLKPVRFDYEHLRGDSSVYQPDNTNSKRLFIISHRDDCDEPVYLNDRDLRPVKSRTLKPVA